MTAPITQEEIEDFLNDISVQVNWYDAQEIALAELLYTTGWRLNEIRNQQHLIADTIVHRLEAPTDSKFVAHPPILPQLSTVLCESLARDRNISGQSPAEGEE